MKFNQILRYQEEGVFMEALIWGKRGSRVENGRFSYVDFVSFLENQSNFALQISFAHNYEENAFCALKMAVFRM